MFRIKSIDEKLSIQEVLSLLNGLNGNVKGNVSCYYRGWGAQYLVEDQYGMMNID